MAPTLDAPASVSVPSADLINYRFDQSDKKFEEMNKKLDQILLQNAHFLSEAQVEKLVAEAVRPTQDAMESWRWYMRAMVSAVLIALATAIASFFLHKG
jgi:hypothetical protein